MAILSELDALHNLAATGTPRASRAGGTGTAGATMAPSTIGGYIEGAAEVVIDLPSFVISSLTSGGVGMWNTGVMVANVFGADIEEANTADILAKFDDNLADYYEEHKAGADMVGFVATSFIPGLGAVKALKAGQAGLLAAKAANAGRMGRTGRLLTGILAPDVHTYSYAAKAAAASNLERIGIMNSAALKAIGTKAQQALLESAVFEVAAVAAAANGDVLKDKEARDVVKDMMLGIGLGTGIGAVFGGVGTAYQMRRATKAVDTTAHSMFSREFNANISEGTRVYDYLDRLQSVHPQVSADDVLLGKLPGLTKEFPPVSALADATKVQREAAEALATRVNNQRQKFIDETSNQIRSSIKTMTPDDGTLAAQVHDLLRATDSTGDWLLNGTKLSRVGQAGLTKAMKAEGDASLDWLVMHGDQAGQFLNGAEPRKWRLADLYKPEKLESALAGNKFAHAKPGKAKFSDLKSYSELDADARFLRFERLKPNQLDLTKAAYASDDIAALKAAARLNQPIKVLTRDGKDEIILQGQERILAYVKREIDDIVNGVLRDPKLKKQFDIYQLAHRLDVPVSYLENGMQGTRMDDLFASAVEARTYTQRMKDKGLWGTGAEDVRIRELPKYLGVQTSRQAAADFQFADKAHMIFDGAATVAARKKVAHEIAERNTAMAMAEHKALWDTLLPNIDAQKASRHSGSGMLTSAGTDLAGPVAQVEYVGQRVNALRHKESELIIGIGAPDAAKLEVDTLVSTHWTGINNVIQRAAEPYVWVDELRALVPTSLHRRVMAQVKEMAAELAEEGGEVALTRSMYDDAAKEWMPRKAGSPHFLEVPQEVTPLVRTHMKLNSRYAKRQAYIDAARGVDSAALWADRAEEFYPVPPSPADYKYYAFVKDTTIAGAANGSTTMLHAATEEALARMVAKAQSLDGMRVYTGKEAERYYKSIGKYEYEKTLTSARVNVEMERNGIYSDFVPVTDGKKLSERFMEFHVGRGHAQVRAAVEAKYQDAFETLRHYGEEFTDVATSRKGGAVMESQVKNPYQDLIKTALDINKFSEYKFHWQADQLVNDVAAQAMTKLSMFRAKAPKDFEQIQGILDEYGLSKGITDAADLLLANHPAGRQPVTAAVQFANRMLATFALRLDPLNAVVNALGGAHMRSSELNFLLKAIRNKNAAAAGELSRLADIDIAGVKAFSPLKLHAEAVEQFASMRSNHPWYAEFKAKGWITDDVAAQHAIVDELAIRPGDTASKLQARQSKAFSIWNAMSEGGAKLTGNQLAESMNRFITAYSMKKVTDLALKHGVITAKDADVMINAMINRVEGTLIASQKPVLFNGSIGGAVSLFQSYFFRLVQQLFRFVGEGTKGDVAYMMALQGSLFGANSLPGFQQLNEHVIARGSTNPEGRTLYDTIYAGTGKHAAELLLYGLPANLMQNNLYTRGDVSPRHALIIPTNPMDVPAVSMTAKAFSAAWGMAKNTAATGNLGHSLFTALEQNGVNRPIAGMSMLAKAAIWQDGNVVLRTGKNTDLVTSQLLDLVQVNRLIGGKPLTESAMVDAYYRHQAYTRRTNEKIASLSEKVRLSLQQGATTPELMDEYLDAFVSTGRKQEEFSKWMMSVAKRATAESSGTIPSMLNSSHGRTMQLIMGGQDTSRQYPQSQ